MKQITKNALEAMKRFNPYNEGGDSETYNKIFSACRDLVALQIIPDEVFAEVWKLDNKLFKDAQ